MEAPKPTMAAVLEKENLNRAWEAVRANKGAPGPDGRDIASSQAHMRENWENIEAKLRRGEYNPGPVRALTIPKPNEVECRGLSFVRYADNIAIFVTSPRAAERLLVSVTEWIEKHLKVPVKREMSGSGPTGESALLGFRLEEDGTISIASKSIQRLKAKVRELWEARQSLTSDQLRDQWRDYIQGWWNYYQLAERQWGVENLTGLIRHHMRKCFWLRWSTPKGRLNALRRLGVGREHAA
jgi:hypothetical protein